MHFVHTCEGEVPQCGTLNPRALAARYAIDESKGDFLSIPAANYSMRLAAHPRQKKNYIFLHLRPPCAAMAETIAIPRFYVPNEAEIFARKASILFPWPELSRQLSKPH